MKITPEYLQQIIQEETNILLFEKRLGRELTTEEIEKLHELFGVRSLSNKKAAKAWEKELEKIRAGESDEERAAADARQATHDRETEFGIPIDRNPKSEKPTQQSAQDTATPEEPAQQGDEGSSNYPDTNEDSGILILDLIHAIPADRGRKEARKLAIDALDRLRRITDSLGAKQQGEIDDFMEFLTSPGGRDRPGKHFDLDDVLKSIQPAPEGDDEGAWGRQGALEVADKLLGDLLRGAANAPPRYKKAADEARQRYEKARQEEEEEARVEAGLKEYLLPLITQVLKENTK